MTAKIQVLDIQAANQIAAGEVVERPVSVVKELIENALDAKATQIEVIVEGSGVEKIRVQDNGQGISAQDLPMATLRHATSKIRSIHDLSKLDTLGFRGEALPSIASVSKMEIISRQPNEVSGKVIRLVGGEKQELADIGCPSGTTITVEDLFFNTPARRKFLKSQNTEFGQISDVIGRLSLAHPDVSFTLKHPKTLVLQTPGKGYLLESIGAVLGRDTARRLLPLSGAKDQWQLEGYISPPELVRSTKQGETLIVNGRIIRSNSISRAILEGYHTLIPAKLYPIAVLRLQIPPHEYDVNVHPTKMEIRFHREKELMEFIAQEVRKTLLAARPIAPLSKNPMPYRPPDPQPPTHSPIQSYKHPQTQRNAHSHIRKTSQFALDFVSESRLSAPEQTISIPEKSPAKGYNEFTTNETPAIQEAYTEFAPNLMNRLSSPSPEELPSSPPVTEMTTSPSVEPSVNTEDMAESPLLALRPLGQVFSTYILATDGGQLVIIDQHAAHERINYERLLSEQQKNPGDCQMLLIPQPLEFTPGEEEALLEHFLLLNNMGFILEHFGTRTYLLRGIPAYSGPYQGETLLRDFLGQVLQQNIPPTMDKLLEEWIYLLACKDSIKAKESLNILEMEQLLVQLSKTQNPYTCPHGRPTMIQLTKEELEHRFYRR